MMLLDTHVWIWAAAGDVDRLGPQFLRRLKKTASPFVSSVSLFEIAALTTAGRLVLNQPAERWIRAALAAGGVRVAELTPDIAIDAGAIPSAALGDPVDRLLAATAVHLDLPLATCDRDVIALASRRRDLSVIDARR
jgi:PIN domain nuclease of toxin-antitoxin system